MSAKTSTNGLARQSLAEQILTGLTPCCASSPVV